MLALVGCPFGTGRIELSQVQSSRPTGASACHDPLHPPTNRWIRAEIARLGRTLKQWREPFLAYFATAGANNGGAAPKPSLSGALSDVSSM